MKVKRLTKTAKLPTKANPGDLGYDLYADENTIIRQGSIEMVGTGIAVEFPDGFGGVIKDRSSRASYGVVITGGVIDNAYRGEIIVIVNNWSGGDVFITKGEKIAQLVLIPVVDVNIEEVSELSETVRGGKGFGSSGA